jgi:hypothetical protein
LATTRKTVLYLILGSRCVWRDRERRVRKKKKEKDGEEAVKQEKIGGERLCWSGTYFRPLA